MVELGRCNRDHVTRPSANGVYTLSNVAHSTLGGPGPSLQSWAPMWVLAIRKDNLWYLLGEKGEACLWNVLRNRKKSADTLLWSSPASPCIFSPVSPPCLSFVHWLLSSWLNFQSGSGKSCPSESFCRLLHLCERLAFPDGKYWAVPSLAPFSIL